MSSGISEKGLIGNTGSSHPNAFSLQLNSNDDFSTPACSGSSNTNCVGWQQFVYTYGLSGSALTTPQVYMQYWLFGYSGATQCPSSQWMYVPGSATSEAGCFMNSRQIDVPALTASDLASVVLTGLATAGGSDEVSMQVGTEVYSVTASDSVLDLAAGWNRTQWGVYGDAGGGKAFFTAASTSLDAQTAIQVSSGPTTVSCDLDDFTAETNNLNLTATPSPGMGTTATMASAQTSATSATSNCAPEQASHPDPAYGLATDALTSTWQAQSDLGSTGTPQPLPTTTGDCGNWSGADATQVVQLGNGSDLWSFGDTFLGPAVARQYFFNNGAIHNSMVLQSGSALTTITGGSGCANGQPTTATAPITSPDGAILWPASSIVHGSAVEKFYYTVNSSLVQQTPEVAEIPQSALESGIVYSATATALSGCTTNPIMWGTATIASGGFTYIYGSQQVSGTDGNIGGAGGGLFLARTAGDPSDQGSWAYNTTSGWSAAGAACGGLTLAALGGSEPIEVPTEFSVTSVNGDFWLVDQDPANGDQPGWAVAHEATTPTGFSNDPVATVDLFAPTQTTFPGIDDSVPGLTHYAVRMLQPAAVAPSQSGDVVIAYNVNDSDKDVGCVPLYRYDANAYRPRFIDVPASDLFTALNNPLSSSALRTRAPITASPRMPGKPAPAAAQGTELAAPASLGPQMATRAGAQLKPGSRAASPAVDSTSFTYNPDAVPPNWIDSCPASYDPVDGGINVSQNPDGSLVVSWPYRGPDVWYWFHWSDFTSAPKTWNTPQLWTEGPNADSYPIAPPTSTTTVYQTFPLPTGTSPGDAFKFWVQPFAAGNGSVTSSDSDGTAYRDNPTPPTSPSETVGSLNAFPGTNAVTLTWTAPTPVIGQADWYSVRYKTATGSTWSYATNYITKTATMTPLASGTEYEFEVAVTDYETVLQSTATLPANATWSAPVYAIPTT